MIADRPRPDAPLGLPRPAGAWSLLAELLAINREIEALAAQVADLERRVGRPSAGRPAPVAIAVAPFPLAQLSRRRPARRRPRSVRPGGREGGRPA
jgi:hypothetical protein